MNSVNVSKLYWNTGIGWPTILFALLMYSLSYFSDGWIRWVFIVISFFWTVLAIYRFRRWTGSPWRKIHFKSMLVFASMAGREKAESNSLGREFEILNPLYGLLHAMIPYNDKDAADSIHQDICDNGSSGLYHILDKHIRGLIPLASEIDLQDLMIQFANAPVGVNLAIAYMIEYEHGTLEAAKYIIAIMRNEV